MTTLNEGSLQFVFATGWDAVKFDGTTWQQRRFGHYKAVDILASHQGQHWWIEIKDCQGHEPANRPRLSATEPTEVSQTRTWLEQQGWKPIVAATRRKPFIIDELIEKVRDTLVSLNFAKRAGEPPLVSFSAWCGSAEPMMVVLLLTWDITDFKRLARLLQQKLSTALQPYGLQGVVVNELVPVSGLDCTISRMR